MGKIDPFIEVDRGYWEIEIEKLGKYPYYETERRTLASMVILAEACIKSGGNLISTTAARNKSERELVGKVEIIEFDSKKRIIKARILD
ncbi:MAG: hypothetical protein WC480_04520 [Patescibacteria group bacterium]